MRTRRDGFTLVELMVVVLIIAIVVQIAVPAYQQVLLRARAAAILGDINVVRLAAYTYHAEHHRWPPDVNRGITPPELVPYLPGDFSFRGDGYVLDWDNWMLPDGTPRHSQTNVLVGISLATDHEELGHALIRLVGENTVKFTIAEHYTFIIAAQ